MSDRESKIRELERLFEERKITLDQYIEARAAVEKGQVPYTEPQQGSHQSSTPQNSPNVQEPPRTFQTGGSQRSYKKIALGVMLSFIVLASGFLVWGYLNPASAEALTIESYSVKALKAAVVLKLRNTGTTNIQITDVKMNGYSYQSLPPMFQEGWNGTTFLQPQQIGSLYVFVLTYFYAINSSMPHLSSTPTETEIDNFFTWIDSYDTTFTLVTSTQRQYEITANTPTVWLTMAWLGSLTFTYMKTEELKVQSHTWAETRTSISLTVKNTGPEELTLNEVRVNDVVASNVTFTSGSATLNAGDSATLRIAPVSGLQFASGVKYEFAMLTATGNKYTYVATAP